MNLRLQSSNIHGYTFVMLNATTNPSCATIFIYCFCEQKPEHQNQPIFRPLHMHDKYTVLLNCRPHYQ
jgi:hypothetical protein